SLPGHHARAMDVLIEEVLRDLDVDACPVAGLAVGIDRTAMPHRLERGDRRLDHLAPRLPVDRRDEADAAGIVLVGGVIETVRRKVRGVAEILGGESTASVCAICHGGSPPPRPLPGLTYPSVWR